MCVECVLSVCVYVCVCVLSVFVCIYVFQYTCTGDMLPKVDGDTGGKMAAK